MASDSIGTLIRLARSARRWTVDQASAAAGMSPQNWGRIERGEAKSVPPSTLAHMADVLEVDPEELVEIGQEEAAEILAYIRRRKLKSPEEPKPPPTIEELAEAVNRLKERFDELMDGRRKGTESNSDSS